MKKYIIYIILTLIMLFMIIPFVFSAPIEDTHGVTLDQGYDTSWAEGLEITLNKPTLYLTQVKKADGCTGVYALLYESDGTYITNETFHGNVANFSYIEMTNDTSYYIIVSAQSLSSNHIRVLKNIGISYPYNEENVNFVNRVSWNGGSFDLFTNAIINVVSITTDESAGVLIPTVNITYPENNTNINQNTNITFNLNSGGQNSECQFYINNTLKSNKYNLSDGNYTFNFNSTVWAENYNIINISCNNSIGQSSELLYLFVDTINPIINYIEYIYTGGLYSSVDLNGSDIGYDFNFNISSSDTNLYSFNLTISNQSDYTNPIKSYYINNLSTENYIFNETFCPCSDYPQGGLLYGLVEICDAHTKNTISDFLISELETKKIIDNIEIRENTDGVILTTTTKLQDKYIFDYTIDKLITEFKLNVISDEEIFIISNSEYKGHMVTGKKWIDFEDGTNSIVELNQISKYEVLVTVKTDKPQNYFKFSSIGEINCINQSFTFTSDALEVFVYNINPTNNKNYQVDNNSLLVNFTYYFNKSTAVNEDNCTLFIDGINSYYNLSVLRYTNYNIPYLFSSPNYQENKSYDWFIRCYKEYTFNRVKYSDSTNFTLYIFNTASTTSTTTTTTTTTTTLKPTQTANINCSFNSNPYLKESVILSDRDLIKWFCTFNTSSTKNCISLITRGNELIQTNPNREIIDQLGIIDYFTGTGFVSVYFDSTDLVPDFMYNFTVSCFDTYYNITITNTAEIKPTNKALHDYVIPRTLYLVQGATALVLIIILVIVFFVIKRTVYKK